MEAFCHGIVQATHRHAAAFKPNLAFFEQYGAAGWAALERIVAAMPEDVLVIADAKRGDIGNTAKRYAKAMFEGLGAHAITVAPYMGEDSVAPFMDGYADRWTIVLALTSNAGADDFEFHGTPPLYERVVERCQTWGSPDELMFVVGATRPEQLRAIRSLAPDHFFLVPGVGAQGGRIEDVMEAGWIEGAGGLLIMPLAAFCQRGEDYACCCGNESCKLLHRIFPEQQAHESIRQTPENRSTSIGKCGVPRKRWLLWIEGYSLLEAISHDRDYGFDGWVRRSAQSFGWRHVVYCHSHCQFHWHIYLRGNGSYPVFHRGRLPGAPSGQANSADHE